jgi:hypothetical protein
MVTFVALGLWWAGLHISHAPSLPDTLVVAWIVAGFFATQP